MIALVRSLIALLDQRDIDVEVDWIDVHKNSLRAGVRDRECRRRERVAGRDHFIARANVKSAQGHVDRIGAVGHPDAMIGAAVSRKLLLELLDLLAENVARTIDHVANSP